MSRLNNPVYLRFPFTIAAAGGEVSTRLAHVREIIEQVLYTDPGERWYRPDFGAGVKTLVFEPNSRPLWEVAKKRLHASLSEALTGEVDPKTLEVTVDEAASTSERLVVTVAYSLAALNHTERQTFLLGGGG